MSYDLMSWIAVKRGINIILFINTVLKLINNYFKIKTLFNTWCSAVLDVRAWSLSGHSWKWSLWTTFWEGKSLESCCVGISGAVHTMGGDASVLEHSSLPWKHRPSARGGFFIAGQSLRLVIIREVYTYSFQCKDQNFSSLLEPSFCFCPGTPCRICGRRDFFGNLAIPSGQREPDNTSAGTGDVLLQQRLRVHARLQIFSCNVILLELLLEIRSI